MRKVSWVGRAAAVLTVTAAAATVMMPGTATGAAKLPGGVYQIRTFAGKCLDVPGANRGDGVPIIQYHCGGQVNQRFGFSYDPTSWQEIRTFSPGKCLDLDALRRGLIQNTCSTQAPLQLFRFLPSRDGTYYMVTNFGLCLEVQGRSHQDGAPIVQSGDCESPAARFTLV
jgi:hypothetical protein